MSQDETANDNGKLYFDLTTQERDSAIRYILGTIINARKQAHFPSNYYTFDEDVNIYLAHLLFAISLPEYHEMAEPYLSMETSDVLKMVRETEDRTVRYFIFKVNADHMIIHTALFNDLDQKHPYRFFHRPAKHYRELGKLYYDQAAAYHKRIYRKQTGVGDVLEKVSRYFENYQNILKIARRDYFNFLNSFRDQAFSSFIRQIQSYEKETQKRGVMDFFLDVYGQWLEQKDPALIPQIAKLVEQIKMVDPEFKFDLDTEVYRKGGSFNERKCA